MTSSRTTGTVLLMATLLLSAGAVAGDGYPSQENQNVFKTPELGFLYGSTLHVPEEFATIQKAVTFARTGDTILVAPGLYMENIEVKKKAITLKSTEGAEVTIIDGSNSSLVPVVKFGSFRKSESVIKGFTIRGGSATNGGGIKCVNHKITIADNVIKDNEVIERGAGIYLEFDNNNGADITNNHITDNSAGLDGGGIYAECDPKDIKEIVIEGNTLADNTAGDFGGGLYIESLEATIKNNVVTENTSGHGGGIACWALDSGTIWNNTIANNRATAHLGDGGGLLCFNCAPRIVANLFRGNEAADLEGFGGAIYLFSRSSPMIRDCLFEDNSAYFGGGVHCYNDSSPRLSNCILRGNSAVEGGGIYALYSTPWITNCTLYGNSADTMGGGLISRDSRLRVVNSIFWNNTAASGPEIWLGFESGPSSLIIDHCDVMGGKDPIHVDPDVFLLWGDSMIEDDPLFVEPETGDFHLLFRSPCRDMGTAKAPHLPDLDFEGDPRTVSGLTDMGADESDLHLYFTGEIMPGKMFHLKMIGFPGTQPVLIAKGSSVRSQPFPTQYGDLYLDGQILQTFQGPIPEDGLLDLTITAPISWNPGDSIPFQALAGTRLTNLLSLKVTKLMEIIEK